VVRTEDRSVGRHVVQFYDHDEELAERVAGYLLGALEGDGAAIVIATEDHRREFGARLEQAGADLTASRDSGADLAMDVSQTVREFMAADRLDQAAFDRVVGSKANSGFTVVLSSRPDVVRISVRDASPLPPAGVSGSSSVLPVAPLHGLGAVNAMASRWGVESLGSDRVGGAA